MFNTVSCFKLICNNYKIGLQELRSVYCEDTFHCGAINSRHQSWIHLLLCYG